MADLSRTVGILFQADATQAQTAVENLQRSLESVGSGQTQTNLGSASSAITSLGNSAQQATPAASALGGVIDELGQKAGLSAGTTDALRNAVVALGLVQTVGLLALVAAVVAAGKAALDAVGEVKDFERALKLAGNSSEEVATKLEIVRAVADRIKVDYGDAQAAFAAFDAALSTSGISAEAAAVAFQAIYTAVVNAGGSSDDARRALVAFAEVIKDGKISAEELTGKLRDVPGAAQALASALGVPVESLKDLAREGALGGQAIDALINKLSQADVVQTSPLKDAFTTLVNEIKRAYETSSDGGLWDLASKALAKGINTFTAALVVNSAQINLFTSLLDIVGEKGRSVLNPFAESFDAGGAAARALEKFRSDVQRGLDLVTGVGAAGIQAGEEVKTGFNTASDAAETLKTKSVSVDTALRSLGIDPSKIARPAEEIVAAFEAISTKATSSSQILAGFVAAAAQLSDRPQIVRAYALLTDALLAGRISQEEFNAGTQAFNQAMDGTLQNVERYSRAQEEASRKAEQAAERQSQAAEKLKLKLLEIESNERIKVLEFKARLDIAQVEANARIATATIEGLSRTFEASSRLVGELFRILAAPATDWPVMRAIQAQLEIENQIRRDTVDTQRRLAEEQIRLLVARRESLQRGDALIKVEATGLEPELEAFMWKILKRVQTRVNREGLSLLLGV